MADDLRDWLAKIDKRGELAHCEGADWNLEIGAISAMNARKKDCPALLFDGIRDYPSGYRVLTCSTSSRRRIELTFDLTKSSSDLELVRVMREKLQEWEARLQEFPYEIVKLGYSNLSLFLSNNAIPVTPGRQHFLPARTDQRHIMVDMWSL